jgi:RNA polymerase sigma-70 factor (ECF subfamily)
MEFTGWVTELARAHTQGLAAIARREGLGTADALDAVQEAFHTFLELPQARALVDSADESRALLATIVRNAARNLRRRHHRDLPHEPLDDEGGAGVALADDAPSVEETLASIEEQAQLHGCLTRLDEMQRRVVTLRMLEELSGADVAARLELSPGHVAVLLHRAKKDLLRCIRSLSP